jgi:hypothetical protein
MYATNGKINDVWIHDTHVNYSAVTGIVIDTSLVDVNKVPVREDDRKVCDAWAGLHGIAWADDPSLFRPRNIRIGDNNIFNGNFQGSIAEGGRWVAVRNNTFTNNYITYNTKSSGGTITFDECADTIQIYGNMMTGPNTTTSQVDGGLELYGRNIYVQDNTITNYPWAGAAVASPYNLFIENNPSITNNSRNGNVTGGILIEDLNAPGCNQRPRDTQGVTISGNTNISGQPDGVKFGDRARNTIDGVSISGNSITSSQYPIFINDPIVVVSGTINGNPCPGTSCAQTGTLPPDPPRALTPDAVGPVTTFRCPTGTDGKMHEKFNFEGADVLGASNVQDLEVDLSTLGPPTGPNAGAAGCHFVYTPYRYPDGAFVNLVYLADGSGGMWKAGNTVVGTGGSDLANGYCTIHAATSSWSLTQDPYILNLTLDIEFEQVVSGVQVGMIPLAYIYVLVTNHTPGYVSGDSQHPTIGAWTYYGSWSQPCLKGVTTCQ